MTTAKPTASMKPAKLPPIQEVFDEAKEMFCMTVETNVKTAQRIDNLLNLRDLYKSFYGEEGTIQAYKSMLEVSVDTYRKVLEASRKFELDEFRKSELYDYYQDIVPKVEDVDDIDSLLVAAVVFLTVQPYGGKMMQLHRMIQDELEKRGELDG